MMNLDDKSQYFGLKNVRDYLESLILTWRPLDLPPPSAPAAVESCGAKLDKPKGEFRSTCWTKYPERIQSMATMLKIHTTPSRNPQNLRISESQNLRISESQNLRISESQNLRIPLNFLSVPLYDFSEMFLFKLKFVQSPNRHRECRDRPVVRNRL
ncbi:Protein CBG21132 [Caenorhabditis briggsae]|uniref:Protein CBG21132 n=1 Tax=Caenorhabditis briggsae TaxID=6238 RepID=A8XZE8_CAEBR|nr:Protein CBG21132 [Caenorhabditis briggsae]CAP38075.2 Protein CBG21132 [Caenorhabditis briggsae]